LFDATGLLQGQEMVDVVVHDQVLFEPIIRESRQQEIWSLPLSGKKKMSLLAAAVFRNLATKDNALN